MKYVNLGCGNRYHPDWINYDISSASPHVISHDLSRGIPLPDSSCDVVYHSHVLEHMRRNDALRFMQECHRVLKRQGILRIAVPDLEQICRIYLEKLNGLTTAGNSNDKADYEWIMLEMYDQTVREVSGGEMGKYLSQTPLSNEAFVFERIGEEGRLLVKLMQRRPETLIKSSEEKRALWRDRIKTPRNSLRAVSAAVRRKLLARWLGEEGLRALAIGRFRLAGEVHQWMYDRYSLSSLILTAGFQDPIQQSATSSHIPQWSKFNLDTLPDGTVNKPDSLFMEAVKR